VVAGNPPDTGEISGCGGKGEAEVGEGFTHVAGEDKGVREMWAKESPCISVSSIREVEIGDGVEGRHAGDSGGEEHDERDYVGFPQGAGVTNGSIRIRISINSKDVLDERMMIVVG